MSHQPDAGRIADPARILFIHAWGGIGDNLMATALVRETKRCFPAASLSYMTTPVSRNIMESNAHLEALIVYDRWGADRGLLPLRRAIGEVRRRRFDLVMLLHRSSRMAFLAWAAGIPVRVGHAGGTAARLCTHRVPRREGVYQSDRLLDLLRHLGGEPASADPELFLTEEDRRVADELLAHLDSGRPWLAVAPSASNLLRRWPADRLAEVMRRLRRERGCELVLTGGPGDVELCHRLVAEVGEGAISCAGATTSRQAAAVMQRCALLLTMDSGAMHLAAAVGCPTVTILGPTTFDFGFAPRGERHLRVEVDLPCRPCRHPGRDERCPEGTHACMDLIAPDEVFARVNELLALPGVR